MSNDMVITVADGVATLTVGAVTADITNGTIRIAANGCGCQEPEVPSGCGSQPQWIQGEDTKFGFKPAEKDGVIQFFPSNDAGEATTAIPDGFWMVENQGDGIGFNFTRQALQHIDGLTITITSSEDGEEPIEIEAAPSGSGIYGFGEGSWQLQEGKTYCVTVTPSWVEPS